MDETVFFGSIPEDLQDDLAPQGKVFEQPNEEDRIWMDTCLAWSIERAD